MKYPSQERAYSLGDSWQGYLSLHLNALFPVCVKGIQMPGKKLITIFIGCGSSLGSELQVLIPKALPAKSKGAQVNVQQKLANLLRSLNNVVRCELQVHT